MQRPRRTAGSLALACLLLAAAAGPAQAYTWVYTDIVDFNLSETTRSYNSGQNFHISTTGDGWASYRWVDYPDVDTVISGNSCSDLSLYGSHYYNAGVTVYRQLFWGPASTCFVLRGRTAAGQGYLYNHDGRLER